jgi:hypothetical protein
MAENKAPTKHLKMSLKETLKTVCNVYVDIAYIQRGSARYHPPAHRKETPFSRVRVAWIPIPGLCYCAFSYSSVLPHRYLIHASCIFIHMLFILFNATFLYSSVLLGFHYIQ